MLPGIISLNTASIELFRLKFKRLVIQNKREQKKNIDSFKGHAHLVEMMKNDDLIYLGQAERGASLRLPLFASKISAGFPSPAEDYLEGHLDLNELLTPHPLATFFLKVSGDSMTGAGIMPDGMLVVDRSIEARHGKIVIAVLDGQLTVKRLYKHQGQIRLMAENPNYRPVVISNEQDLQIWGVVTNVINPLG